MESPTTRYATTTDGIHVAYQVVGDGPIDVVFAFGWTSHLDLMWELPIADLPRKLARTSRLILFDRRGAGLSDRAFPTASMTLEAGMDDIRAVMDAAGSERAVQCGFQDGGMLSCLFAATYPDRTSGLFLFGSSFRGLWAPDYPWGWRPEEWETYLDRTEADWGTPSMIREHMRWMSPSFPDDDELIAAYGRLFRSAASPGSQRIVDEMIRDSDIRSILPMIQVPTLVVHNVDDPVEPVGQARFAAQTIPGAELIELPFAEHAPLEGGDALAEEFARFARRIGADEAEFDRVLATVLFTDIVDSTAKSAALGDRAWREMRDQHDHVVRANLARFRGREIKTMGDGFLATFDGPVRGVRCAEAIATGVRALGIEIRAGLHTGEVALDGEDVAGLGVAIGARVGALAGPSEVLISQTVKDLVAGSEIVFEDAGEHELKGVPDRWRLYRVVA